MESPRRAENLIMESPRRTEHLIKESPRRAENLIMESPRRTENLIMESPRRAEHLAMESPRRAEHSAMESPRRAEQSAALHDRIEYFEKLVGDSVEKQADLNLARLKKNSKTLSEHNAMMASRLQHLETCMLEWESRLAGLKGRVHDLENSAHQDRTVLQEAVAPLRAYPMNAGHDDQQTALQEERLDGINKCDGYYREKLDRWEQTISNQCRIEKQPEASGLIELVQQRLEKIEHIVFESLAKHRRYEQESAEHVQVQKEHKAMDRIATGVDVLQNAALSERMESLEKRFSELADVQTTSGTARATLTKCQHDLAAHAEQHAALQQRLVQLGRIVEKDGSALPEPVCEPVHSISPRKRQPRPA